MSTVEPAAALDTGAKSATNERKATELGPVAESYDELHRIDLLSVAKESRGLPEASYDSALCAVFQAAEVCLLNLSRLTGRMQLCVLAGDIAAASRYVEWVVGFHRLVRKLGRVMFDVRSMFGVNRFEEGSDVSISGSVAYTQYVDALLALEDSVKVSVLTGEPELTRSTIASKSSDDSLYRLLHGMRVASHDATKWESDLSEVPTSTQRGLEDLTAPDILARAVAETELSPATLHGEFVALHQIPEILCAEANDHLEVAIQCIRSSALTRAVQHLAVCRTMLEPVVEAQRVMAEHLATGEYHEFRTNLGAASGMHSLAIRQHMFRDLFKHLWSGLESWLRSLGDTSLEAAMCGVDKRRHGDSEAWLRHSIVDHAFRLHSIHQEWRHEHLHMPRNCLGSGGTKSMIGVKDGPDAVRKMRDAANAQRSLVALHQARQVRLANVMPDSPLTKLIADPASLDSELLRVVGEATRECFPEVQQQSFQPFRSGATERNP
jgi:hypothetical protein